MPRRSLGQFDFMYSNVKNSVKLQYATSSIPRQNAIDPKRYDYGIWVWDDEFPVLFRRSTQDTVRIGLIERGNRDFSNMVNSNMVNSNMVNSNMVNCYNTVAY